MGHVSEIIIFSLQRDNQSDQPPVLAWERAPSFNNQATSGKSKRCRHVFYCMFLLLMSFCRIVVVVGGAVCLPAFEINTWKRAQQQLAAKTTMLSSSISSISGAITPSTTPTIFD